MTFIRTLAGCGLGVSASESGSQFECGDFCDLNGPSKERTTSVNLNTHTAEP